VVPTIYVDSHNRTINSNQYSVTEHFKPSADFNAQLPGVFFFYDLSPIKVGPPAGDLHRIECNITGFCLINHVTAISSHCVVLMITTLPVNATYCRIHKDSNDW